MAPERARTAPLNGSEIAWLAATLDKARALAAKYDRPILGDALPDGPALDRIWSAWLAEWESFPEGERPDANEAINALGCAFGQRLAERLKMKWVIATDEYGTELAVYGDPGDVLVYPPSLVARRFESRTRNYLAALLERMCADIERDRAGAV